LKSLYYDAWSEKHQIKQLDVDMLLSLCKTKLDIIFFSPLVCKPHRWICKYVSHRIWIQQSRFVSW